MLSTSNARRPRIELHPDQHPQARVSLPTPSRSPSAGRHTTVRRRGTIAHEFPYSTASRAPEDPVDRAKYVAARKPEFIRDYRVWVAEAPDERGPLTEESICSEEDDPNTFWEEEEFETEVRVTVGGSQRLAKGTGGDSRRGPMRTRYVTTEQRYLLAVARECAWCGGKGLVAHNRACNEVIVETVCWVYQPAC